MREAIESPTVAPSRRAPGPEAAIERSFLAGLGALLALGSVFLLRYRSSHPELGPYTLRYLLGVLVPCAFGVLLLLALLLRPEVCRRGLRATVGRLPTWVARLLFLALGALALGYSLRVADEYASVLLLLALPLLLVALWVRTSGRVEAALAASPILLLGLGMFLVELPGFLEVEQPLVLWGEETTFAFEHPAVPPFIGPGGRLRPGLDVRMRAPEYRLGARLVTNSLGLRTAAETAPEPAAGVTRILLLGDSFSTGFSADQDAFFGSLLERDLGRLGVRAEVLPAEVSDPAYGLYYLEQHGVGLHPSLVVYGLCGNDVQQTSWFVGPTRRFDLDAGTLVANPRFEGDAGSFFAETAHVAYARPAARVPTPRPRVAAALVSKLSRFAVFSSLGPGSERFVARPSVMPGYTREYERSDGRLRLLDGYSNLGFFHVPRPSVVDELMSRFFSVLDAFDATARRAGAAFVLVAFPQRYQVQPADWAVMRDAWNLAEGDFDLELFDRDVLERCRGRSLHCLDLLPAMREAARQRPLYLGGGDMHFNRHGHAAAAAATAALLVERGLLVPASSPP